MRYTISLAALAAIGVHSQASVTAVQPITQISDGQIQAPPSTYSAPPVVPSSAPVETPSMTDSVVVPTAPATTVVIPSVPVSTPIVVVPSSGGNGTTVIIVPSTGVSNSTMLSTTGSARTTPSASGSGSESESGSPTESAPPQDTGAANVNMVSFGGIALAIAGFVLV